MANNFPQGISTEKTVELPRLGNLSDGVFAIALTLLVLDIHLPTDVPAADLPASLLALAPRLLVYLISFIIVGGAWGSHQRMVSQIERGDGLLVWINLCSLLFVTLIPASAGLLGSYPGTFIALVCFAVNVILIQLSARWLWQHATRSHLINPLLDARVVVSNDRRLLLSTWAFVLSMPLALLNPVLVYIVWIGLFVLIFTTDWLSWQQAAKTVKASVPLNGAARAELGLVHTVGSLKVQAGDANDQLLEGTFGGGVDVNSTLQGDVLQTHLHAFARQGLINLRYPWTWDSSAALDWNLTLNPALPLKLNLEMGMNEVWLDFRDLQLETLSAKANASYVDLWLPNQTGQTSIRLEGTSATYTIHVPPSVALHVSSTNTLSGLEVDASRFVLNANGHEYRSADYDTAAHKIDIQLDIALGSVRII